MYHFGEDGRLKSGTIQQDNAIIRYGDDGSIAETIKFQEGWNLVDGVYYYLKDGKLLENTTSKLPDGKLYSFDELGRMRNNIKYYGRYYDESGAAMTGWIYDTGKWYYADPEDATLYSGFQTINGKKYYFFDHYDPSYNEYAILSLALRERGLRSISSSSGTITLLLTSRNGVNTFPKK